MADSVNAEDFKSAMRTFASGVTVVTTVAPDGTPCGLTASAFTALSMDPPLCLVCVDKLTGSYSALRASKGFGVNVLAADQEDLSNRFASSRDDKFDAGTWEAGPVTGSPLLAGALAAIDCELHGILDGGDHDIFVGRLVNVVCREGAPLLYWNGAYGDITSRPKAW